MVPVDYSPPANPHLAPQPQAVVQSQRDAKDGRAWRDYTVRPGDSLAKLAATHETTIAALVRKNKIEDPRVLVTGTKIKVPGAAPKRSSAPATKTPAAHRAWAKAKSPTRWTRVHTVRRGENLSEIATQYGTTWRAVLKANKVSDPRRVKEGEQVKVPVKKAPAKADRPSPPKAQTTKAKTSAPATAAPKPDKAGKPKTTAPTSRTTAKSNKPKPTKANTFLGRTYSDDVVSQAAKNRRALQHTDVPSRSQTRALIVRTAQRYGVDPQLALGVAWQESGWNQRAVSVANAVGVMQVMPGTGEWCGRMAGRDLNLRNAEDNVTAGVVFLRWLTQHAKTSDQAIAGYYQGLGSVEKKGMYPDTKTYVKSVRSHMTRF